MRIFFVVFFSILSVISAQQETFESEISSKKKYNKINDSNGFDNEIKEIIVQLKSEPLCLLSRQLSKTDKSTLQINKNKIITEQERFIANCRKLLFTLNKGITKTADLRVKYNFQYAVNAVVLSTSIGAIQEIKNLDDVKAVYLNDNVYLSEKADFLLSDLQIPESEFTGKDITIAILDTGIDQDHFVFKNKMFLPGYDFVGNDPVAEDIHGHGTHCAGIAAAKSDTLMGIAPDANLMAVKVLDDNGFGTYENIIKGIEFAANPDNDETTDDAVDIISMSLGESYGDENHIVAQAIDNISSSGIVCVVSAGNDYEYHQIGAIAAARSAITVTSLSQEEIISDFSSKGPTKVDYAIKPEIAAPGELIRSSIPGNKFDKWSGTSMATPAIAGYTARLLEEFPLRTPGEIKSMILLGAEKINGEFFKEGFGKINYDNSRKQKSLIYPSSLSLGLINTEKSFSSKLCDIEIKNVSGQRKKYSFTQSFYPGIQTFFSEPDFELNHTEKKLVTIRFEINHKELPLAYDINTNNLLPDVGYIKMLCGTDKILIPFSIFNTPVLKIKKTQYAEKIHVFDRINKELILPTNLSKNVEQYLVRPSLYDIIYEGVDAVKKTKYFLFRENFNFPEKTVDSLNFSELKLQYLIKPKNFDKIYSDQKFEYRSLFSIDYQEDKMVIQRGAYGNSIEKLLLNIIPERAKIDFALSISNQNNSSFHFAQKITKETKTDEYLFTDNYFELDVDFNNVSHNDESMLWNCITWFNFQNCFGYWIKNPIRKKLFLNIESEPVEVLSKVTEGQFPSNTDYLISPAKLNSDGKNIFINKFDEISNPFNVFRGKRLKYQVGPSIFSALLKIEDNKLEFRYPWRFYGWLPLITNQAGDYYIKSTNHPAGKIFNYQTQQYSDLEISPDYFSPVYLEQGKYRLLLSAKGSKVNKVNCELELISEFDTKKEDPIPPSITSLNILVENEMTEIVLENQTPKIKICVYEENIGTVKILYKISGAHDWHEVEVKSDNFEYWSELSLLKLNGYYDLKLVVEDLAGNWTSQEIKNAFYFESSAKLPVFSLKTELINIGEIISWKKMDNVQKYYFQLAGDSLFNNLIINKTISDTAISIKNDPGYFNLYYRISNEDYYKNNIWSQIQGARFIPRNVSPPDFIIETKDSTEYVLNQNTAGLELRTEIIKDENGDVLIYNLALYYESDTVYTSKLQNRSDIVSNTVLSDILNKYEADYIELNYNYSVTDGIITVSAINGPQILVVKRTPESRKIPDNFKLHQNYPNPFNPLTTIRFDLPVDSQMNLSVFNSIGELVEVLAEGFHKAGEYKFSWNASQYSSGVYFFRIKSDNFSDAKKMILLK